MKEERLSKIILSPHMSEKATLSKESNGVYVFRVIKSATKPQIKQGVEFSFKTKVKSVRIVKVKPKPKRFGNILGKSKAWKKAYVTLQEGHQIDLTGGLPAA